MAGSEDDGCLIEHALDMKKALVIIIMGLISCGCEKEKTGGETGELELRFLSDEVLAGNPSSQINSPQGSPDPNTREFFLDTLKASKTFYFILSNSGNNDITDITLSTDHQSFIVSPSSIPLIPGSSGNEIAYRAFSVDVLRGTMMNGIGSAEFLPMGENTCHLSIQGTTGNGASEDSVKFEARVVVFAEFMSVSIVQGGYEYDLNNPDIGLYGAEPFPIDRMNIFLYYTIDPPVAVRNTGNVAIEMSMASFDTGDPIIQTALLQPGDTINFLLPLRESDSLIGGKIRLGSNGTVFDINQLSIGRDGAAYFALAYPHQFWRNNHPPPDRVYGLNRW
jgi:hypothetical protein